MTCNVGGIDRVLRLLIGLALLSLPLWLEGPWRWAGLLGLLPLGTALLRHCPAYPRLGLDTCRERRA
ncbi:YgaP-like transmembrane domain [Pseudoroseomonas cervicalis]|uniref:YgaP-like transmembrane domain n=1 Tax=Teichococcus cervicalis TaxID=204525 RepID=UPI0022F194AD|nr:YgaP-like transmembrane domain [Pseudoroseomonas cervicalis]WBV45019.1 DUF2892 domain-containing protein [Pseudoroseomonas cervicalis]